MTRNVYQKPETAVAFLAESCYLMAGSVRNDDQTIFQGDPDPSKVDPGDQNTHPADSKQGDFMSWGEWDK